MAPEKRLIDANKLSEQMTANFDQCVYYGASSAECQIALDTISEAPTVDAVVLPCKIGDTVWVIRCYKGVLVPQQGKVSEMLFTTEMKLSIVVKHICRGEWGDKVFATREDAKRAIANRRNT